MEHRKLITKTEGERVGGEHASNVNLFSREGGGSSAVVG